MISGLMSDTLPIKGMSEEFCHEKKTYCLFLFTARLELTLYFILLFRYPSLENMATMERLPLCTRIILRLSFHRICPVEFYCQRRQRSSILCQNPL
jgi:hypothetical protein